MKKVLLIAACAVFAFSAQAQEDGGSSDGGLYVDVNLGYNFGLNSQNLGSNGSSTIAANGDYTSKREAVTGSFGKGMKFGANVGYMFNANLGAELGINYLMGGTTSTESSYSSAVVGSEFSYTRTSDMSASMLQFNPTIVLTTGAEGLTPYAKFGIVIGTMGKITKEEETKGPVPAWQEISVKTTEISGGIALGWSAALGVKYALNDKMSFFGELNMVNMSYAPSKGEITAYSIDGTDVLSQGTTRDKETEYVDETTSSSTAVVDETKPREEAKQNYSFSSLGIQVGLHIAF